MALVARREDRSRALADEIAVAGGIRPFVIVVDLQRSDATYLIGEALAAQGAEPQFMANNAGFGRVGTAAALDRDEQLAMIDANVRLLTQGRSPLSTAWRTIVRGPQCRLRGRLPARAKSMAPAILSLSAEHVPEAGYRGLMQGRRTVVAGLVNKLVILVIRIVPRRIVVALVDARQRRRRPAQTT